MAIDADAVVKNLALVHDLDAWLEDATDVQLELVLRRLANQLVLRGIPDTVKLFDVCRRIEQYRAGFAAAGDGREPGRHRWLRAACPWCRR